MADETGQLQPETVLGVAPTDATTAANMAQANAENEAIAATLGLDETVPGGAYRVGDSWVDCNGNPTKAPKGSK